MTIHITDKSVTDVTASTVCGWELAEIPTFFEELISMMSIGQYRQLCQNGTAYDEMSQTAQDTCVNCAEYAHTEGLV